jgi:hypothetical protein
MGKSVFLRQVKEEVERTQGVRAILFPAPPPELTMKACLDTLARQLGSSPQGPVAPYDLLAEYLSRADAPLLLVLIYDEFDGYAKSPIDPPGRGFFNSLEAARRENRRIAILAAGGIGVFLFRDVLGSDFLSRASRFVLSPFEPGHVEALARPLADRTFGLSREVLESLQLAAGGHPALVTYGLQELWDSAEVTSGRVSQIFGGFQLIHHEFLRAVYRSFSDPSLSTAPQEALGLIWSSPGCVPRAKLQEACGAPGGALRLDVVDVLDLLQAAGLVRVTGSINDDPLALEPIPSLLSLPAAVSPALPLRARLPHDLEILLGRLHALGVDFYRASSGGRGKELVPEAVFSAFLALGMELSGWQVERESQSAAGRTDLKLRRNSAHEYGVIEVKIWGRNDYRDVHRQVESYWTGGVVAGAVVMLADVEISGWAAAYRKDCIPLGVEVTEHSGGDSAVTAKFVCTSATADGLRTIVDHFLLRIPRR